MDGNQPETAAASGQTFAPQTTPERVPFTASKREQIAAFAMYVLAYVYILFGGRWFGWSYDHYLELPDLTWSLPLRVYLAVFALGFFVLAEYLHRDTPRPRESWVWLGCAAALLCSILLNRGRAWDGDEPVVFLHIFAVWWALSRSNALLAGESGRLLPLDALDGFLWFPLRHFFLRIRTVGHTLSRLRGGKKREGPQAETVLWSLVMSAARWGCSS